LAEYVRLDKELKDKDGFIPNDWLSNVDLSNSSDNYKYCWGVASSIQKEMIGLDTQEYKELWEKEYPDAEFPIAFGKKKSNSSLTHHIAPYGLEFCIANSRYIQTSLNKKNIPVIGNDWLSNVDLSNASDKNNYNLGGGVRIKRELVILDTPKYRELWAEENPGIKFPIAFGKKDKKPKPAYHVAPYGIDFLVKNSSYIKKNHFEAIDDSWLSYVDLSNRANRNNKYKLGSERQIKIELEKINSEEYIELWEKEHPDKRFPIAFGKKTKGGNNSTYYIAEYGIDFLIHNSEYIQKYIEESLVKFVDEDWLSTNDVANSNKETQCNLGVPGRIRSELKLLYDDAKYRDLWGKENNNNPFPIQLGKKEFTRNQETYYFAPYGLAFLLKHSQYLANADKKNKSSKKRPSLQSQSINKGKEMANSKLLDHDDV